MSIALNYISIKLNHGNCLWINKYLNLIIVLWVKELLINSLVCCVWQQTHADYITLHWLLLNLNSSLTRNMTLCGVKVYPSPPRKDNTNLAVSLQVSLNNLFIEWNWSKTLKLHNCKDRKCMCYKVCLFIYIHI